MSLIHQVLQDIDNREARTEQPGNGYAAEKASSRGGLVWLIVLVLVGLMLATYLRPDLFNLNLLFSGGQEALPQTTGVAAPSVQETAEKPPVTESTLPQTLAPVTVNLTAASAAQPQSAVVRPAAVSAASVSGIVSPEPRQTITADRTETKPAKGSVVVTQKERAARDLYKRAVTSYQEGDYASTLSLLNQALMRANEPDYLTLKARVYVDQGALEQFLDIYRSNSGLEDPSWLKVVAPGLHIFRLYPQAAAQYGKLTQIYPRQAEWAMARFQALKDAGEIQAARSELERMERGYSLTAEQAEWVRYQKKRMI